MRVAFLSKTEINIEHLVEGLAPRQVKVCRSRGELCRAIPEMDVLVVQNQGFTRRTVDARCLQLARKLRLIQHHGVACDATDVNAATRLGIPVAVIPGQNSRSVAEHAFFLLLALARRAREAQRLVQEGRMGELQCTELEGKTLCLVGMGTVGKMLAKMGKGFSMRVIGVRKTAAIEDALAAGADAVWPANGLHQALASADFTILALPLTAETSNLMDAVAFAAIKPGAMLINVSRGAHVNREALVRALREGRLRGFATDAYWDEPADPGDPLLDDERVIVTPHMGGKSIDAIGRTMRAVRANIERLEKGEPLLYVVNGSPRKPGRA